MKAIKLLFIICVSLSFAQCKTIKLTENAPFTVTGGTYHSWVGGQPGVKGINVIIGIENEKDVSFSQLFFMNRKETVSLETKKGKKYIVVNMNTSSNTLDEITVNKPEKKSKEKANKYPFTLQNHEAVISYQYKGKTFYYKVAKLKKTETIFYP